MKFVAVHLQFRKMTDFPVVVVAAAADSVDAGAEQEQKDLLDIFLDVLTSESSKEFESGSKLPEEILFQLESRFRE